MPGLMTFLGLDSSAFDSGLNKAGQKAASAGKSISSSLSSGASSILKSFGPALSAGAIIGASKAVLDYAGKIQDLSDRTGISTDALQEWDYALQQSGSSIDSAVGFFEKLMVAKRAAMAGGEKEIAAFQKFGLTLGDISRMDVDSIGMKISEAVKSGDVETLIPYLRDVGGRSAGELVAAFKTGLGDLRDAAKEAGAIIDEETISKMDEVGDKFTSIWTRVKAAISRVLDPILTLIDKTINGIEDIVTFIGATLGGGNGIEAVLKAQDVREKGKSTKAEARKSAGAGFGMEDGPTKEQSKAAKDLEAAEKKLEETRYKNWFESLNREQKIAVLKKQAQLADINNILTKDRAQQVAMMQQGEEAKAELQRLLSGEDKKSAPKKSDIGIDALQSAGAYVRGDSKMLSPIQQSEKHLRDLVNLSRNRGNQNISGF